MSISFQCEVETQPQYRLGEPINITCQLRNTGDSPLWVLRWGTFLEGLCSNFVRVTIRGVRIPYDGVLVKHASPNSASYVRMMPGETVSAGIDVSTAYAIDEPGDYEISLAMLIRAIEKGEPPQPPQKHERIRVSSNTAILHVLAGGTAIPTLGAQARAESSPAAAPRPEDLSGFPKNPLVPKVVGASTSQTKKIMAAHNWGYDAIVACTESIPQGIYTNWFGTGDSSTVNGNYQTMAYYMSNTTYTYSVNGPQCKSDWYGYTYIKSTTIYLCALFFSDSWGYSTSAEDQSVTVVHEISHAAASTGDMVYGETECEDLAESDPSEAINNADNYGYCALEVYPDPDTTDNGIWTTDIKLSDKTTMRPSAAGCASIGTVMTIYQDNHTNNPWLWFRTLNVSGNKWGPSTRIYNPVTKENCQTLYAPALAVANQIYYCVYVDGDSDSKSYKQLVCIFSGDSGDHWSLPSVVSTSAALQSSPALAYFGNVLYCVFVDASQNLNLLTGTPSDDGVSWSGPTTIGAPYQSTVEPGLGVFNGQLYCVYTHSDSALRYTSTSDGTTWATETVLDNNQSSTGIALASWESNPTVLVCVYRGPGNDSNLRYSTFDGTNWTLDYLESSNRTQAGPAIAAYGQLLYAFHNGASNDHIYYCQTQNQDTQSGL
jgi:peptidyl-Lys metalloendopeptidase